LDATGSSRGAVLITLEPIHLYEHYRFGEIISHGVWLYHRFSLRHRAVEELLFGHGVIASYEAIRT